MAREPLGPSVVWYQRPNQLLISIHVAGSNNNANISFEEDKLTFKGTSEDDKKDYAVELEFFKEIDPEKSNYVVRDRRVDFVLEKKEAGHSWDRLLKTSVKQHWLKFDFSKWEESTFAQRPESVNCVLPVIDNYAEKIPELVYNTQTGETCALAGQVIIRESEGMMEDPVQSSEPVYVVPCVGPIGDIRPILEVEVNGMKTTMLFASGSGSNCIAEDQVKLILPTYLNILRPSRKALYYNISGENIGEVDLDLKVGYESITAAFCVVRNGQVAIPLANTSDHLLIGGITLQIRLGMGLGPGVRQMSIKLKKYSVPCIGPIGDNGPILLVELNGTKTTMLFSPDSESSCIPESQLKEILPNYIDIIRPSQKMLYYKISGENIGEVDLELKVGEEHIHAAFCVVRMPENVVIFPAGGSNGHLLIGGIGLLTKLGMVMGPGEREMTITPKKPHMLLLVGEVREAVVKRNWVEMDVGGKDEVYGILKFQKEKGRWLIEIHCSTGAVQTTLDHPSEGRNQANVSVRTMQEFISVLEKEFGTTNTSEQPKKTNTTLDVEKVREAAIARNWIEMKVKEKEKGYGLLRFQKEEGKWQINIYCSTGAVQTTLMHPTKGRNQLDRSVRNLEELISILDNPRKHTNRGYRRNVNKPKN